mgnify:CR=1 FL=1
MANIATIHGTYDDNSPWAASVTTDREWVCDDELILTKLMLYYNPKKQGFGPFGGDQLAIQDAAKDLDATIAWGQ